MQLNWIDITGWLNCVLLTLAVVPQIIKTIKTKITSGISIWVYVLIFLGNIDALIYATLIEQVPLQIKYVFGAVMALFYILVYFEYKGAINE